MSSVPQRSFSAGELAPALHARADHVRYATGLRTMRNFYVMRHGGATSRPGTVYKATLDTNTTIPRLVPFVNTDDSTYALVLGKNSSTMTMRAYKNGALSYSANKAITGVTNANPCVVTCVGHGLQSNHEVYITGVGGTTQLNGNRYFVIRLTANTFSLLTLAGAAVDSTAYGVYTAGGNAQQVSSVYFTYSPSPTFDQAVIREMQYNQRGADITFAYKTLRTPVLTNVSDSSWTYAEISYTPTQGAPTALIGGAGGGPPYYEIWAVTAVSATTGEESVLSNTLQSGTACTAAAPQTITWTAPSGTAPAYYNVYKFRGAWGFFGTSQTTSFIDNASGAIDYTNPPPTDLAFGKPFPGSGNYPGVVGAFGQRGVFSGNPDFVGKVWASRSSTASNFAAKAPSFADDPVVFTLTGKRAVEVRHIVDAGKPVVLTSTSDFTLGADTGVVTPTSISPNQQVGSGAAKYPQPLVVDGSVIYVQARGSRLRDMFYQVDENGYRGNEISLFAAHLFEGRTVVDWAYQEIPHQLLWVILDDGSLLSLTYVKEQQIFGWARHDTDGDFKSVCAIPGTSEDDVYFIVERTINSSTKTYLEKLNSRYVDSSDYQGYVAMDCAYQYDGRASSLYAAGTIGTLWTMTLSGGTAWNNTETLTLTSSGSYFVAGDVGKGIRLLASDGTTYVMFTISGYTSGTVVTGSVDITVPASLRSTATTAWAKAITVVTGLDHLEGKAVSVFADSEVVASPNNSAYSTLTVSGGSITLPRLYARINVGLPFISDLETLDIDAPQGNSIAGQAKHISGVNVHLEKTRGGYIGVELPADTTPLTNLSERRQDSPDTLFTGPDEQIIYSKLNTNGRVAIRQVDPLPITVLAITPQGKVPYGKG